MPAEAETESPIPISAVQHAVYCLRQAALIHIERLWAENCFTAEGDVLHSIADKGGKRNVKGVRRVMSVPLASRRLNLTGGSRSGRILHWP
jgi:CRISPR-associated exonuclease Cas4